MPISATSQIWFGTRSVDALASGPVFGNSAQVGLLTSNDDFATRTIAGNLVDQGGIQFSQLLAFTGNTTQQAGAGINLTDFQVNGPTVANNVNSGDLVVGSGVVAHNLADMNGNGRMTNTSGIDRSDDPVSIFGHGKASLAALTGFVTDGYVTFSNANGFGFINTSGWESTATSQQLNDGDSVSFDVAASSVIKFASFVVRTSGGAANVVIDSDGMTIRDTNGAAQGGFVQDGSLGELNLGALNSGDLVKIDFDLSTITVNNVAVGGTAAFFSAFAAGGADVLTLGSMVGGGGAWSADDLILTTGLGGPETGPGFGYLSFDLFTAVTDPAPGGLLASRLYAYFDADETGTMSTAEAADAENLGQMRPGWFGDDPSGDGDDNPVQGAGPVDWVDLYVIGRANTSGFAAPAQAQYGEPQAGNVAAPGGFALSVNTGRNEATITPGGPNGSPLDIDNGPSTFNDSDETTIELGEIVGIVLKTYAGRSADIVLNVVSDAPAGSGPDVDMIVRLYQGSTLIETLTYDLALGINTVTAEDNLGQAFDRMEIAATGSMAGEIVGQDFGAAFIINDLNIRIDIL